MTRETTLWGSVFAGPLIWVVSFGANYALAPWACALQWKPALYIVSAIAMAVSAVAGGVAWNQWQQLGREWPGDVGTPLARDRMLAISGVLLSAMFFLVVLAQALTEVVLGACE